MTRDQLTLQGLYQIDAMARALQRAAQDRDNETLCDLSLGLAGRMTDITAKLMDLIGSDEDDQDVLNSVGSALYGRDNFLATAGADA